MAKAASFSVIAAVAVLSLFTGYGPSVTLASGNAGAVFSAGPQMNQARNDHWSLSLPDGRVALLGGRGPGGVILNSAEIWNPATNSFISRTMDAARWHPACARLNDGRYFLAGGWAGTGFLKDTEIFDPGDNSFTDSGNMTQARVDAAAATLTDGRVLIVGNYNTPAGDLFNPGMGNFTATQPLNSPRASPVVVPTSDGQALVLGGSLDHGASIVEQVERFETGSKSFTVVQDTLFAGESGWSVQSPNAWGSMPLDRQQLQDGRYLFLAMRQVGATTTYQTRLFTVNHATQAIAPLVITPALPDFQRLPESLSPQVIVNKSRNRAYLLVVVAASEIRLYTIDLNTLRRNQPGGSYVLPAGYYVAEAGSALLQDGRLFFTGGMDNVSTENPIKNTLLARVPENLVPLYLLLLE
jgi:hypothetical protein